MKWLKKFKEIVDNNPEIGDAELFRAFPELQSSPERMNAALMYWKHGIIADEFKTTLWQRVCKLWQK